jgi:hypothetical protein
MDREVSIRSGELNLYERADARDLRSEIAAALAATPVDGESLRRDVSTYACAARQLGISSGRVILWLTELVESSSIVPKSIREIVTRRVILWSVQAYYGRSGDDSVRFADDASTELPSAAPPMRA